ncbi:MAG: hypothetical protein ACP5QN_02600 [Minisyncoccia bacterium]
MFKKINFKKILIWVLILIFLVLLQIKLGLILNYKFNLTLLALIVFSFYVGYLELIFLSLLGIFLINWKPNFSLEIILLFLIPQLFYLTLKKIKWDNFFGLIFFIILGDILFYGLINYKFILDFTNYFIYEILINILFGILLFYFLKYLNHNER